MQYSFKKYAHFVRFGVFSCFGSGQFNLYYLELLHLHWGKYSIVPSPEKQS